MQRCQWHKRENVLSYLSEEYQSKYRGWLQRVYSEPDYETAKIKKKEIITELREINRSASRSLKKWLEETLIIYRLVLVEELRRSFTTTNLIKNLYYQLQEYLKK